MGGAFLAAAVLARVGGRIGLPTIPLFILAGILLGPHTPGVVLLDDPHDLEMLSALGLVLLLFYLGLEFHLDDLKTGGRKMALAGGTYLALNVGAGLGFGFALGWGTSEALVLAGVLGISSSAIVTKVLVDLGRLGSPETGRSSASSSSRTSSSPSTWPPCSRSCPARTVSARPCSTAARRSASCCCSPSRPGSARSSSAADRHQGRRTARHLLPRGRRLRRRGLGVVRGRRRDRRVHGRPDARQHHLG